MPAACRLPGTPALYLMGCLLLAACADDKPKGPSPEVLLEQAAAGGYVPAHHYPITELRDTWHQGETDVEVTLLLPHVETDKFTPYPLVIYLPALGESPTDGGLWRRAWAQAGYAVLAVQAKAAGPDVWSTPRAYAGEFPDIAREAFAVSTLPPRLSVAAFALAQAKRRAAAAKDEYTRVDYGHVVMAGFDYGAQTAVVAAGARVEGMGSDAPPTLPGLSGVILLSPYPGREPRWDYSGVAMPALSITGGRDGDPYGILGRGALRSAPWIAMPPGGKYQLLLAKASHSLISGVGLVDPLTQGRAAAAKKQREREEEREEQRRRRKSDYDAGSGAAAEPPILVSQPFDSRQVASILAVSTAFLDAVLGNERSARLWLQGDAAKWIEPAGRLESK